MTDKRRSVRSARYAWALLLARIYEVFPLICPKCGGETKIIAFTIEGGGGAGNHG